jgi:hypothetical protein
MKKMTIALTILNVVGGVLCSFYIFGTGSFSKEKALSSYPIFGMLIPALACFTVGLFCTMLERKRDWKLILGNSAAYATIYLFIGTLGLPEAILQRKWGLLVWLGFAAITIGISFVSCLAGTSVARKILHNQNMEVTR